MRADAITTFSISTCSIGNNADRRAGGKVAARCRCRVRTPMPLRGACGTWHWRAVVGRHITLRGAQIRPNRHFRGAQQARSAPRTNVRELFCCRKITRNDSDEAERRERSPSGVVSAANAEELTGAARQVSGEAAPASGSAPQPDRPQPPARGSGGRARRPPEPSAGRRCGTHYPPGSLPDLALKSCYPPGTLPVLDAMQSRV